MSVIRGNANITISETEEYVETLRDNHAYSKAHSDMRVVNMQRLNSSATGLGSQFLILGPLYGSMLLSFFLHIFGQRSIIWKIVSD